MWNIDDPTRASRMGRLGSDARWGDRRLPVEPLERCEGEPITRIADKLGRRRQAYRWRAAGLTLEAADEIAARLGLPLLYVWPDAYS